MAHGAQGVGADDVPGRVGVDAGQAIVVGDGDGRDVRGLVAWGPAGQVQEVGEEVLGPIEVMRMAVAIEDGGNPLRVAGDEHAAHRAGVGLGRAGYCQLHARLVDGLTGQGRGGDQQKGEGRGEGGEGGHRNGSDPKKERICRVDAEAFQPGKTILPQITQMNANGPVAFTQSPAATLRVSRPPTPSPCLFASICVHLRLNCSSWVQLG